MHFTSTLIVAFGTLLSTFWILAANSWMQTPQGFEIRDDGLFYPTSWMEIIFNPSFPYRLFHTVTAAYLTTAFVVGAVGSYYILKNKFREHAKVMVVTAMLMAFFIAPLQLFIGHMHGENTMEHQPIKIAAMEGHWERGTHKPLYLIGVPNQEKETTDYTLEIPNGTSIILTGRADGEVPGLKDVAKEDRPPVAIVFWSFRVMVGVGMLMILTGAIAAFLFWRKKLFDTKLFQLWCLAMGPAGFVAILAGWFVTEVGRQPYTVYGVLRTTESISPVIAEQVAISLALFVIIYTLIFGAGIHYMFKIWRKGPDVHEGDEECYYDQSMHATMGRNCSDITTDKKGK